MGSVVVIRNAPGRQFTDLTSLAIVGGIAFGSIYLRLCPLIFDPAVVRNAECFGSYYARASHQEIYDQYCRVDSIFREQLEGPGVEITKSVKGISIGISTGGSLDAVADFLERPARIGWVMLRRTLGRRIGALREAALAAADDATSMGAGLLTSGTSGGLFQSIDGGALQSDTSISTLDLSIERIQGMNMCVLQLGGGIIVGAGVNIVFIGNFPSLNTLLSVDGVFTTDVDNSLFFYIGNVLAQSYCHAFIADAAIGAILPGIDLNIIGT